MSNKTRSDTSRFAKNPLLSAATYGLDDFTQNAILLPAAPPAEPIAKEQTPISDKAQTSVFSGEPVTHDTETFSEISLDQTSDTELSPNQSESENQSALGQGASSLLEQLPSVASTVLSSFSNFSSILKGDTPAPFESNKAITPEPQSNEETLHPDDLYGFNVEPQTLPEEPLEPPEPAVTPTFYSPDDTKFLTPSAIPSAGPLNNFSNAYRLSSKKKIYAQVPGLNAASIQQQHLGSDQIEPPTSHQQQQQQQQQQPTYQQDVKKDENNSFSLSTFLTTAPKFFQFPGGSNRQPPPINQIEQPADVAIGQPIYSDNQSYKHQNVQQPAIDPYLFNTNPLSNQSSSGAGATFSNQQNPPPIPANFAVFSPIANPQPSAPEGGATISNYQPGQFYPSARPPSVQSSHSESSSGPAIPSNVIQQETQPNYTVPLVFPQGNASVPAHSIPTADSFKTSQGVPSLPVSGIPTQPASYQQSVTSVPLIPPQPVALQDLVGTSQHIAGGAPPLQAFTTPGPVQQGSIFQPIPSSVYGPTIPESTQQKVGFGLTTPSALPLSAAPASQSVPPVPGFASSAPGQVNPPIWSAPLATTPQSGPQFPGSLPQISGSAQPASSGLNSAIPPPLTATAPSSGTLSSYRLRGKPHYKNPVGLYSTPAQPQSGFFNPAPFFNPAQSQPPSTPAQFFNPYDSVEDTQNTLYSAPKSATPILQSTTPPLPVEFAAPFSTQASVPPYLPQATVAPSLPQVSATPILQSTTTPLSSTSATPPLPPTSGAPLLPQTYLPQATFTPYFPQATVAPILQSTTPPLSSASATHSLPPTSTIFFLPQAPVTPFLAPASTPLTFPLSSATSFAPQVSAASIFPPSQLPPASATPHFLPPASVTPPFFSPPSATPPLPPASATPHFLPPASVTSHLLPSSVVPLLPPATPYFVPASATPPLPQVPVTLPLQQESATSFLPTESEIPVLPPPPDTNVLSQSSATSYLPSTSSATSFLPLASSTHFLPQPFETQPSATPFLPPEPPTNFLSQTFSALTFTASATPPVPQAAAVSFLPQASTIPHSSATPFLPQENTAPFILPSSTSSLPTASAFTPYPLSTASALPTAVNFFIPPHPADLTYVNPPDFSSHSATSTFVTSSEIFASSTGFPFGQDQDSNLLEQQPKPTAKPEEEEAANLIANIKLTESANQENSSESNLPNEPATNKHQSVSDLFTATEGPIASAGYFISTSSLQFIEESKNEPKTDPREKTAEPTLLNFFAPTAATDEPDKDPIVSWQNLNTLTCASSFASDTKESSIQQNLINYFARNNSDSDLNDTNKSDLQIQNFFNNPPPLTEPLPEDQIFMKNQIINKHLQNISAGPTEIAESISISSNVVEPPSSAQSEFSEGGADLPTPVNTSFRSEEFPLQEQGIVNASINSNCDPSSANMATDTTDTATNIVYRPVYKHWFYKNCTTESKQTWTPFTMVDSMNLEDASGTEIITTDGGRFDVNKSTRQRLPIYWNAAANEVRRCSWFYKGSDSKLIPYEEETSDQLEELYRDASNTGEWHRKLPLANGETVVFHSPGVIVHFLASESPDNWPSTSQTTNRPRVVKRGIDDFNIEDGESEQIDHLMFMVHGIGAACDLKFRPIEEVVDEFRSIALQLTQSHYRSSCDKGEIGRVEILPIAWHSQLHSEESGIDEKLKSITLESIPKLRAFTNDTLLDILFYTSPRFCQQIMNTVSGSINSLYEKFCQRNPTFKGQVSLSGHSLGSLILFDLLQNQKPDGNNAEKDEHSSDGGGGGSCSSLSRSNSNYTIGRAGTGQPYINYPQLKFKPKKFFALGSPIGMFVTVRGIDTLGLTYKLPTTEGFYNIFHPYDPVAYRIEALINSELANIRPVLVPHHKGRKRMHIELRETMQRVRADIKHKILETYKTTMNTVCSFALLQKTDAKGLQQEVDKVLDQQLKFDRHSDLNTPSGSSSEIDSGETDIPLGLLNEGKRIDYVLQEAPLESFNEYLFAMTSHVCYWESEDTTLFIIKEIYSSLGVQTDNQIPQQSMTIERPTSSTGNGPVA